MQAVRRLRIATALVWLTMGFGHLFGPAVWRSSPSYHVIASILPLRAWGGVFVAIGMLQLASLISEMGHRIGLVLGAGVAAMWATSFVAAALVQRLTGVGGPALYGFLSFAQVVESGRPLLATRRTQ